MNTFDNHSPRLKFLASCLGISLAAIALSSLFLLSDRLPSDVIAIHWNERGQANGAGTVLRFLSFSSMLALAPALLSGVVALAPVPEPVRPRAFSVTVGVTAYFAALAACVSWSAAVLNDGASSWRDADPMRGTHLAVISLLPLALGAGAVLAAQRTWPSKALSPPLASSLNLEPDERVFWSSDVRASGWLLIGFPLAAAVSYAVAQFAGTLLSILVLVASLVLADAFSVLRLTVNFRGLSLRYGHLGLFRQHISLANVEGARSINVRPLAHGGWGYRGSLHLLRKAAVVVRGGDGIELTLKGGRLFVATVDDAATGAALLNGLVKRPTRSVPISEQTGLPGPDSRTTSD